MSRYRPYLAILLIGLLFAGLSLLPGRAAAMSLLSGAAPAGCEDCSEAGMEETTCAELCAAGTAVLPEPDGIGAYARSGFADLWTRDGRGRVAAPPVLPPGRA